MPAADDAPEPTPPQPSPPPSRALIAFTPVPRDGYIVGVPDEGYYQEIVNSDSAHYGGSNIGNAGGVWSEPVPAQGFSHSIRLRLPPLACLFLKKR